MQMGVKVLRPASDDIGRTGESYPLDEQPRKPTTMTTPTVTELIRNGNPVTGETEPAHRAAHAPRPVASPASTDLSTSEKRRAGSHLRVAAPAADRAPSLPLAA